MPTDRGQEHRLDGQVPYPITGSEVLAMFKLSSPVPPWPDEETCELLAEHMSLCTAEGERRDRAKFSFGDSGFEMTKQEIQFRVRWEQAVRTLRQTPKYPYSFPGNPYGVKKAGEILEVALAEIEILLMAKSKELNTKSIQTKNWAFDAIAWSHIGADIFKELGRRGGLSRNSVGVKFAALAIYRIGWRDEKGDSISPGAIANYCARGKRRNDDHNLSPG